VGARARILTGRHFECINKTTATTYGCKALPQCQAVQMTKLGGQKKTIRRRDSGKTECKETFSKRILMNHEEKAEK
jgi:hypothetical protein